MINKIKGYIYDWMVYFRLRSHIGEATNKAWRNTDEYEAYLGTQLKRTLAKKDDLPQLRTQLLIDLVASEIDLTGFEVLCVGARNTAEIDYFESKGAGEVVGIDLFSENEKILVMDMHKIDFPENKFDLVYSCHSLEHAYDPKVVAKEFLRVCRPGGHIVVEVPVQYQTRGADLVDFSNAEGVLDIFSTQVEEILISDTLPPNESKNLKTSIARILFQVKK